MGEQKKCPYCGQEIKENEKFCANCGKALNTAPQQQNAEKVKKTHKTRNIIIGAAVILLVIIIAGSSGEEEPVQPVVQEEVEEMPEKEQEEKTELTPVEIYSTLAQTASTPYTLNDKATVFISSHPDLFPASNRASISDAMIDYSLEPKFIQKNESKYGDKMMSLPLLRVIQIWEESIADEKYLTTMNAIDDATGEQYYIYYIGELGNVFDDSTIDVVGLPLGNSSFTNTQGGDTLVIVLAGSSVQMVQ